MSLWCGSCREEIFEGFGLLYRMEVVEGALHLPTKDKKYVPPNSAICDRCWSQVPVRFHLAEHGPAMNPGDARVFAYSKADSSNSPFWGSKQWSDIKSDERYVFLSEEMVLRYLEMAVPIIVSIEDFLAKRARSLA